MLISERIYKYLEEKGITQKEFADRTGISQSTVSDWRRKGTNPSADKIMIICDVLDITPYELLVGTENKKFKEYKETDCIVISKQTNDYELLEILQGLDAEAKKRVEMYARDLQQLKEN